MVSTYGYVRFPHFERMNLNKAEIQEQLGVEKLFVDWITAAGINIMPSFYDMLQKSKEGDKIVIQSLENLGFSNGTLYGLVKELRDKGISFYTLSEDIMLTDDEHFKLMESTQNIAKANQMKGIKRAMEKGVKFGREIQYATDEKKLNRVMLDYDRQAISWREAADKLGIEKKTTFFYRYHKWEKDTGRK